MSQDGDTFVAARGEHAPRCGPPGSGLMWHAEEQDGEAVLAQLVKIWSVVGLDDLGRGRG